MREIHFGRPTIGDAERTAVMEVLNGPILVHGPRAVAFEKAFAEWTGAPHAVSTSSCTASLHLCYFYLGLGRGDEVIVPAQTHAATAHAVELTGATPIFVDAEQRTGNIDIAQIEAALTPRTRAISVVHYLGLPVDMDAVNAIAKKYELFVVEDCALSLGSRYRGVHTGLLGDIAPTGRKVRLASTIIYRFDQGRVIEEWEIFDKLGMYQQLGVTPPPA